MTNIEEVTTFLKWCGESFKKDEDIEDKDNPFYLAVKIIETQEKKIEGLERDKEILLKALKELKQDKLIDKIRRRINERRRKTSNRNYTHNS